MFRSLDDFSAAWSQETTSTLKVLHSLTDASMAQPIVPGGRTLGFLAWHLTCSFAEMGGQAALGVDGPTEKTQPAIPARAADIAAQYEASAASFLAAVKEAWTDAQLGDLIPMYGEQWPKGLVLSIMIGHQAHHRGQMTVLMRQAGVPVPGMYGPSREEWEAMGVPPLP
ncbi:MAG: DinB family protein [Gemmatimonadota bacterium]|nr:DinB family protein [Gemmatimonadota bacterium]